MKLDIIESLKLYPGKKKILYALLDKPKRFGELQEETQLSRVSLSDYLKELIKNGFVAHNKETREYYIPAALQPLKPESFPAVGQNIPDIMKNIKFTKDAIARLKNLNEKELALSEFLGAQFGLLIVSLMSVVGDASTYEDHSFADDFIQRSIESYFIPWISFLAMASYTDVFNEKLLSQTGDDFLKIAERLAEDFRKHFPSEPLKDISENNRDST